MKLLFAALALFSSLASASTCSGYYPDVSSFTASPSSLEFGSQVTLSLDAAITGSGQRRCSYTIGDTFYSQLTPLRLESIAATFTSGDGQSTVLQTSGSHLETMFTYPITGTYRPTVSGIFTVAQDYHVEQTTYVYNPVTQHISQRTISTFITQVNTFDFSSATFVLSHAPEPQTYAMLLAGIGLLGWRRK